ncbi:MAG: recombination-associated protein RdgC [Gammaproteobacteria bacterium]
MWFKNLVVYRLPADWSMSASELEDMLSRRTLQPCSPFEMFSRGWVPPASTGRLLHTVNQQHLIALGVDQKLLPGAIIKQVAQERAALLANEQGFPVGRRQMRDLRMRVTEELRARALTRRRITRAWIDPENGWFIIDAAGAARAEELVETLRDTIGSLSVTFMDTAKSPQQSMSSWLMHGDAPTRFSIDQDLELQSADATKATIRYTRHPLDAREVQAHLKAGKFPMKLGLTWSDRISFVLTEKAQVKRLEFLEMSSDAADTSDEIDAAEQFDIDFAVMAGELAKLLDDLGEALGGQPARQAAAA